MDCKQWIRERKREFYRAMSLPGTVQPDSFLVSAAEIFALEEYVEAQNDNLSMDIVVKDGVMHLHDIPILVSSIA